MRLMKVFGFQFNLRNNRGATQINNQNTGNEEVASECEQLLESTVQESLSTTAGLVPDPEAGAHAPLMVNSNESSLPITSNSGSGESVTVEMQPPPKPDMYAPPAYDEIDYLVNPGALGSNMTDQAASAMIHPPTYEEVQRQKAQEAGEDYPIPANAETNANGMQVVRISSLGGLDPQTAEIAEEQLLGTDLMFFVAFTAAFVFNWVGFVLLLCFCHTVAGRTGALAGFGLSLAKWAVIVRNSTDLVADNNTWLLWLIMVLGLLICVRAILQYVSAKREWQQLPHNSRHRFFLFY